MSHDPVSGVWDTPPPSKDSEYSDKQQTLSDKNRRRHTRENHKRYSKSRSRSHSHSRNRHRDHRSRHSRDRYRHRSSRYSHKRRHRSRGRYSRSRSRSRSPSRSYRRRRTRSRSRSLRKYSHSRSNSNSSVYSDRESLYRRTVKVKEVPKNQEYIRKVYSKPSEVPVQENSFKNDGSFLEMFKKMQEEKAAQEKKAESENTEAGSSEPKKILPVFGKRRGGKVLKTGMVQKLKNSDELEEEPKDAWSVYMKEVKRYKEACCDDDSKTRPLVK